METSNAMARCAIDKRQLIVALDVETAREAREIIAELKDHTGAFKIGLQLFTSEGADFIRELTGAGIRIFLDVKFHDIPNTVAKAAREAARLGVWMFNIHALGGSEMMVRAKEEMADVCEREGLSRPKIIGVTVLTSADSVALEEAGIDKDVDAQVLKLAKLASKCGLDGVVASPHEVSAVRDNIVDRDFLIVTPGIRSAFATKDDQKRVMTPGEAVSAGSDYLVVGRPILEAQNRLEAIQKILGEN